MKKEHKSLFFTFGSVAVIATPVVVLVSCGNDNTSTPTTNSIPSNALRLDADEPSEALWTPILNNSLKSNDWIAISINNELKGSKLSSEDISAIAFFKDKSIAGVTNSPNIEVKRNDQVFNYLAPKIASDNLIDVQVVKEAMGVKVNTIDSVFNFSNDDTGSIITINNVMEFDFNRDTAEDARNFLHIIELLKNTPGMVLGVKFVPKAVNGQTTWSDMAYVMKKTSEGFIKGQDNYIMDGTYTLLGETWQHDFSYYDSLAELRSTTKNT